MNKKRQDLAKASPTKNFFVAMLTRDIQLPDAILDLVDNCLDGALRSSGGNTVDYSKFHVTITFNGSQFLIEDNCGGIPREIAKHYAFKLGRDPGDSRDAEEETIGMYGVGMKRAIFKMGRNAVVRTKHGSDSFEVPITPEWLSSEDWDPLPIQDTKTPKAMKGSGTSITIDALHDGVAKHFSDRSFENDVRTALADHFTIFLQKGLRINVNNQRVSPTLVEVLLSRTMGGPAPYVYTAEIDAVRVSIVVGLNGLLRMGDTDEDPDTDDPATRERYSPTAGWTVLCNDRAILVGDRSRITGWGDKIPLYHPQFAIVTGIASFHATDAQKLPVTTTKRSIDTTSDVWLQALTKMKDGLRLMVTYTNAWKNHKRQEVAKEWEKCDLLPADDIVTKLKTWDREKGAEYEFHPFKRKVIGRPEGTQATTRRIVFARPIEDIQAVSQHLFDTDDKRPAEVGEQCFDVQLRAARKR